MTITPSRLLLLIAVVLFVLEAFGVQPLERIDLGWLGLAFFAAAV